MPQQTITIPQQIIQRDNDQLIVPKPVAVKSPIRTQLRKVVSDSSLSNEMGNEYLSPLPGTQPFQFSDVLHRTNSTATIPTLTTSISISSFSDNKEDTELKAGFEIQNILYQKFTPKEPSPLLELVPSTPSLPLEVQSIDDLNHTMIIPDPVRVRPNANQVNDFIYSPVYPCDESDSESEENEDESEHDNEYEDSSNLDFEPFGFRRNDDDNDDFAPVFYDPDPCLSRYFTPPSRCENPMCSDDRFQFYSSTPTNVGSFRSNSNGAELGIFNFSPPIH
jgi:hypothetical protein